MLTEGTRLKDRYRLERLLGRGGMASVWRAHDERLDRDVAIKALADTIASDAEFLERFRREARIAASLSHPNLIGVYDYSEGEERPYLVMEYVAGPNLAERLRQGARIDCGRLARELLNALAHVHAAGILHRDVKPQNVLLGADGGAKLIDFGIALPDDATSLTRTGNVLGTARYIAPEVMAGEPASERSDLYSCGVVLRDCLGSDPQGGRLRPLVDRLAAADPGERPASAAVAAGELTTTRMLVEQPTQLLDRPTDATQVQRSAERPQRDAGRPRRPAERPRPPAATPSAPPPASPIRRSAWRMPAIALAALAVLGAVLLLADGGGDGGPDSQAGRGSAASEAGQPSPDAAEGQGETGGEATVPTASGDDPALGATLNEEGFALIQAGSYEEAVPVLEEAVRAFPSGTEDLNYAYALFNLGNALRLAGRPEAAIPVLERRLAIPNQTDVVRSELEAARSEAGA